VRGNYPKPWGSDDWKPSVRPDPALGYDVPDLRFARHKRPVEDQGNPVWPMFEAPPALTLERLTELHPCVSRVELDVLHVGDPLIPEPYCGSEFLTGWSLAVSAAERERIELCPMLFPPHILDCENAARTAEQGPQWWRSVGGLQFWQGRAQTTVDQRLALFLSHDCPYRRVSA
jgi:hypothetical protein